MERVENEQKMGNSTVLCSHVVVLLMWCSWGKQQARSPDGYDCFSAEHVPFPEILSWSHGKRVAQRRDADDRG